jgi:pyridoxal phosphate enzyme (YggS family)
VSDFGERLAQVQQTIVRACESAGRAPGSVRLIAVSKTHPPAAIGEAVAAGLRDFGENRVEEAADKIAAVTAQHPDAPLTWHMIGHVQSRKARLVAPLFGYVHSVDSLKLAARLAAAQPEGRRLRILLECNVSGEASKGGFEAVDWRADAGQLAQLADTLAEMRALDGLEVCGMMTMAPIVDDMEDVRPVFRSLRLLRDALEQRAGVPLPELSMGMTDDYPVAVAEGATMVRVGRALFGARQP